jgi:two-component system cell cycle response regulator CpdR
MIENRHTVLTSFEPLQGDGAAAPWVGRDLIAEQVEVRGKRILVVEDDECLRACLRMMLELDGHQVTEASNGAEALRLFTVGEFDLVITDFEMPIMNGNELALGIKLLAASLPILMITASEKARRDVQNPVDALMYKPFTASELHRALGKLLWARPNADQSATVASMESPSVRFGSERQILASLQA